MAHRCGLNGKQARLTAGAWEMGRMTPSSRRRIHFSGYLWDDLGLRNDPPRFAEIWEMLCEEWGWAPLTDQEWHRLTNQPRPTSAPLSTAGTTTMLTIPIPPAPPFQAPAALHHFVGRADLLDQLTAALTATSAARAVALVGMGGIGKTTLATQAAHALQPHFPDGVLWAQTAISTPLDILQSWARALGYDYSELHDVESCAAALRSAVATRKILYVLDNVESVQRVRPLLIGGGASVVLLTTRSEDAAVALGAQPIPLAELTGDESTQLLVNLLGAARVAQESAAAAQIGELLHHLPLAVEIVGQLLVARSRRPLAQMAQRLQDVAYRLDLQISDRDVRTSFLVSWEALDGEHQRLFAHLAVFAGRSFTVQALAALLGADEDVVWDQLDLLVARSLVKEVGDDRYSQHPLLADFAREQLGDAPAVWARFAESQLVFAREHQTDYAVLEPEWDNVMTGMEAAHRLGLWETVVEFAEVLGEAWEACGRYTDALCGYSWAVSSARLLGNESTVATYLVKWGFICSEQSAHAQAKALLKEGLVLAKKINADALAADALFHLARIEIDSSNHEAAHDFLLTCLDLREKLQDTSGMALTVQMIGFLAFRDGNLTAAKSLCHQAIQYLEREQDLATEIRILRLQIDITFRAQEYKQAEQCALRALQLAQQLQYRSELAEASYSLAKVKRSLGELAKALTYIDESQTVFDIMGNTAFLAATLFEKGAILKEMNEVESAIQCILASLDIVTRNGDNYNKVFTLLLLGELYACINQNTKAKDCWQQGKRLAQQIRHPKTENFDKLLQNHL